MRFFLRNKYSFLFSLIFLVLMQSCGNKEANATQIQNVENRAYYSINLFSDEEKTVDTNGKLTLDEAFEKSQVVLRTNDIQKIDFTDSRGVKPFYIYQINAAVFDKKEQTPSTNLPILIITEKKISKSQQKTDSMYLFLEPIKGYELLNKSYNLRYKVIDGAPEVFF